MPDKQTVNVKTLKDQLDKADAPRVIDLRDGDSYLMGHIPGALSIPIKRLEIAPGSLPSDKPVVLYGVDNPLDALYEKSLQVLRDTGLKVLELEGGLKAWTDAGYPLERENNKTYDDLGRRPEQDENASIGDVNKD